MNKIIVLGGVAALLVAGIGGTVGVMEFMPHHPAANAKPKAAPVKPIVFAQLPSIVINAPADSSDPTSAMVQLDLQFATRDPNALTAFTALQPIIKSEIISLLMSQTVKSLKDPDARNTLTQNCVNIANSVLTHSANYTPANPFTAAYITNLVVQN
ncbi:MAG: hypothetical protein B7X08_02090 [Acidocella sp. 20-63-7]|nr:MAG: hypothetical protein B7X08_02090 [Acidocella sp. 20-63-7]HQT45958.1 flagellar basal body-associated FliL family protein [Acidocella sp.]